MNISCGSYPYEPLPPTDLYSQSHPNPSACTMDLERGNNLPIPSTMTKFQRRNAISGPSPTFKLLRSNTSSASSRAVEEDEKDVHLSNEDKEEDSGTRGQEMRGEEPDEKSESEGDIWWRSGMKEAIKRLIWLIFALAIPLLTGHYLPILLLLRREYAGIAPLQSGTTSNQEDSQASSGKALRYQVVNHQSIDSEVFLHCREGTGRDTHAVDSPYTPVPAWRNSSFSCPAYPIRGMGIPSL